MADGGEKVKSAEPYPTLLREKSAKDRPRQKWYQLSGQGLIEAAKTVGAMGKPVIESTKAVLGLLAP